MEFHLTKKIPRLFHSSSGAISYNPSTDVWDIFTDSGNIGWAKDRKFAEFILNKFTGSEKDFPVMGLTKTDKKYYNKLLKVV
jgi:hypothetical protein